MSYPNEDEALWKEGYARCAKDLAIASAHVYFNDGLEAAARAVEESGRRRGGYAESLRFAEEIRGLLRKITDDHSGKPFITSGTSCPMCGWREGGC